VKGVNTDYGILAEASGAGVANASNGKLQVGITNNNVDVQAGALDAIRAQARNFNSVCAKITGNTTDSGGTGFFGIFVRQANSAVFQLDGAQGSASATAYLAAANPLAPTRSEAGTITLSPANTCVIPT
jgi:hypothetical protein